MQYNNKDYKPKLHDRWRALTVKNPYATQLVTAAYEDNGIVYGEKCIEVRSKNTPYRGDLMVCSSANPVIAGYESGVTLGLVELYDVKPGRLGKYPHTAGKTQIYYKGVRLDDAEPPPSC